MNLDGHITNAVIKIMLARPGKRKADNSLMASPGSLAKALGIITAMTGIYSTGNRIWIEDQCRHIRNDEISVGPRIGIDYAHEDASRPSRFIAQL
jgi:DNA-3-methyladenine glycosylase